MKAFPEGGARGCAPCLGRSCQHERAPCPRRGGIARVSHEKNGTAGLTISSSSFGGVATMQSPRGARPGRPTPEMICLERGVAVKAAEGANPMAGVAVKATAADTRAAEAARPPAMRRRRETIPEIDTACASQQPERRGTNLIREGVPPAAPKSNVGHTAKCDLRYLTRGSGHQVPALCTSRPRGSIDCREKAGSIPG